MHLLISKAEADEEVEPEFSAETDEAWGWDSSSSFRSLMALSASISSLLISSSSWGRLFWAFSSASNCRRASRTFLPSSQKGFYLQVEDCFVLVIISWYCYNNHRYLFMLTLNSDSFFESCYLFICKVYITLSSLRPRMIESGNFVAPSSVKRTTSGRSPSSDVISEMLKPLGCKHRLH